MALTSSSGYLSGDQDPYRALRANIQTDVNATPLDPRQDPRYQAYLPQLREQIASDFASRGLGDSGLASNAATQAETNLYADLYGRNRGLRLQGYGIQAGIPYPNQITAGALSGRGSSGGGGGYGGGDPFASLQRDQALRLQNQQLNMGARQAAQQPYQTYQYQDYLSNQADNQRVANYYATPKAGGTSSGNYFL